MNASASEFPCGHSGVDISCFTPSLAKYNLNSLLLKGGPLSDFNLYETPCRANIASTFGMKHFADVLLIISASGHREYLSIKTIIHCPVGIGP